MKNATFIGNSGKRRLKSHCDKSATIDSPNKMFISHVNNAQIGKASLKYIIFRDHPMTGPNYTDFVGQNSK
jgi:hypothetical protein